MSIKKYHYRVRREAGQVKRDYVGPLGDPVVSILFRTDRLSKAEKTAQRKQHEAETKWYADIKAMLTQHAKQLTQARDLWLIVQGYRVRQNKSWKRTRSRKLKGKTVPSTMTREDFDVLVKLAENGDAKALESLRELMRSDRETFRPFGDLSGHVRQQLLSAITRGNLVAREALNIKLEEMRSELQMDGASGIHRLAIEQVLICWLDVHYQAICFNEPNDRKTRTDAHERRLTKAQKRLRESLGFLEKLSQSRLDDAFSKTDASPSTAS